ncbi:alpha/beta hydrolase [Bacillus sp. 165]|uniref:alpha/beta hydrolase n=1 Tax=Bacillus sp. 165 TaxID=1529117 RepID=UPI001AD9DCCD|nr:alpha/beta hydrolase [Bacillus sp. 165]MBO9130774.1 alpha/beta hydrolase [Bacillus sp. 165]
MKNILKYIMISIIVLLLLSVGGFYIWSQQTYSPSKEMYSLVGNVNTDNKHHWAIFEPQENKETGIILYPGAKVEPEAYSYFAKGLANDGYTVIIPHVKFNFAIFDVNKAEQVMKSYPSIKKWYVGGHSLGGVAAASYAYKNLNKIEGIIFLGSYPSNSNDFSNLNVPMLSLYAERDGLSTISKIKETKHLLSQDATMYEVLGGNHAQFGMYGEQKGDKKATIKAKQQQDKIIEVTTKWLDKKGK